MQPITIIMKLSYKPILLLLTIISITGVSCKKEKPAIVNEFPKTLEYQGTTFLSTERVFTNKGEVTDPAIKAKAIVSTGLNLILHPSWTSGGTIVVNSKNEIQIGGDKYSFIDESQDHKSIFSANVYSVIPPLDAAVKFAPLYKYPGLKSSGNNFIYQWPLILQGDYSATKISQMDFCYLQRDPNTGKVIARNVMWVSNEFNTAGLSTLGDRDTVAIREYTLNYAEKK